MKNSNSYSDHLRRIGTIARKDLFDALKNKTALTVLLSALFLVVMYRLIPVLTSAADQPELIVADPGDSALVERLADSPAFLVFSRPDEQSMLKRSAASEASNLALVIPLGFDQLLSDGHPPALQGYTLYWVRPEQASQLRQRAEVELSRLAGQPISINPELTPIYPAPGDNILANWAAMALILALAMVNIQLIPNLMLEEKQTHTLDALLISPATAWDLAGGKALVGLFYSFLIAGIILGSYAAQILQWGLALSAVLLSALFLTPLGLLVGQRVESRAQLGGWVWLLLIPLIAPVLMIIPAEFFPAIVLQVARLLPTGALLGLTFQAFSPGIAWGSVFLDSAIVLAWTVPLLAWLVWSIRRMDRAGSGWMQIAVGEKRSLRAAGRSPQAAGPDRDLEIADLAAESPALAAWLPSPGHPTGRTAGARIILTIAAKDLREALRNKVALLILLSSLVMILLNSALPLLLRSRIEPTVLVYDPGHSKLLRTLVDQSELLIGITNSREAMEAELGELPQTYLGLSLPVDFDQRLGRGETILLESSLIHWADPQVAAGLASAFRAEVERLSAGKVSISSPARLVYPSPVGFGQGLMVAQILAFILFITGITLTPLLLVEEKAAHTLDALSVSPARAGQVIAGKALVGLFYGLLAAAVVLLLNRYLFAQWWVVLLAVIAGTTFGVALGLLIGALSNNPTTVGLWGGMVLMVLVTAGLLSLFSSANWPAWLRELLTWLPSGALIRMIRLAMLGAPDSRLIWGGAGLLMGLAVILFFLADLRLRRVIGAG
ncbi:MAG: ABC transporter permease [Anaerolineales bacterium]|nr:ABC transporter permease [Anaerolineales bacterium]